MTILPEKTKTRFENIFIGKNTDFQEIWRKQKTKKFPAKLFSSPFLLNSQNIMFKSGELNTWCPKLQYKRRSSLGEKGLFFSFFANFEFWPKLKSFFFCFFLKESQEKNLSILRKGPKPIVIQKNIFLKTKKLFGKTKKKKCKIVWSKTSVFQWTCIHMFNVFFIEWSQETLNLIKKEK